MKRHANVAGSGLLLLFLLTTLPTSAQRWAQLAKPATGPTPDLYGVHFFTRDSGYVCGEINGTGRLYLTVDGGLSWRDVTPSLPGTPGPLNDIHFIAGIGAVAGDGGYVAITRDHGASWQAADVTRAAWPSGGDIQGVHCRSALECFAVGKAAGSGNGPRIARTSDGGATWIGIRQSGAQNNLYDVDFFDILHGAAVGTGTNARKSITTDGGITWEPDGHIGSDPSRSLSFYGIDAVEGSPIAYASGGNVVGSGRFAEVRKTTDGGITWSSTGLDAGWPGNNKTANSVLAFNREILYVTTQGFRVYRSTDGGGSWSLESLPTGSSDLRRICATPTDEIYTVGRAGTVLRVSLFAHPSLALPTITFGRSCAGEIRAAADTLRNAGIARLRIEEVEVVQPPASGVRFSLTSAPETILAGDGEVIGLRAEIDPLARPGFYAGWVRIRTNDSLYQGADTLLLLPLSVTVAPGGIAIDSGTIADAGYVRIGRSAPLVLRGALINPSECPVTVTGMRLAFGTDFKLGWFVPQIIAAGAGADIELLFEPTRPCFREDTLIVEHDASSGSPLPLRIVVHGTGLEQSLFAEPRDTLRLKSTPVALPAYDTLRLVNRKIGGCLDTTGILSLTIEGAQAAEFASDLVIPSGGFAPVPPHDELRVVIVATPMAPGRRVAQAIVRHTVPGSPPDTIVLVVNGLKPELTSADDAIQFATTQVGGRRDTIVTGFLINLGDAAATIDSMTITGVNGAEFGVDVAGLPRTIASGERMLLAMSFQPADTGERRALLYLHSTARAEPLTVELIGRGALPAMTTRAARVSFPPTRTGMCRDTLLPAFIANRGELPLRLASLRIAADPSGSPGDSAAFSIVSPRIPPELIIAPGDSIPLTLRFCPDLPGIYAARLFADHNGTASPYMVSLAGTSYPPPTIPIDTILFPPTHISTTRDSAIARFIINGSIDAVTIDSLVVAGMNAAAFVPVTGSAPLAIAPGNAAVIELRYSPVVAGLNVAELAIYIDGGSAPLKRVVLAGIGLSVAIDYGPAPGMATLDFGRTRLGMGRDSAITLTNISGIPLAIDEIGTTDGAFVISVPSPMPVVLEPGVPARITVRYAPIALGRGRSALRIRSGGLADSSFVLAGNGVQHALRAEIGAIDFGLRVADVIADTVVRLINEPSPAVPLPAYLDAVSIDSIAIAGAGGIFSVIFPTPTMLAANGRDSIMLRYVAPLVAGVYDDTLLIFHDRRQIAGSVTVDTLRVALTGSSAGKAPVSYPLAASLGPAIIGRPGDTVRLPLILSGDVDGAGFDALVLRIGFRSSMLKPIAAIMADGAATASMSIRMEDDRDYGAVDLAIAASGGFVADTIATMAFKVLLGDSLTATLRLDTIAAVSRPDITFSTNPTLFMTADICDPEGWLIRFDSALTLAIRPNPAASRISVEYRVPAACALRLAIFDATGAEVAHLAEGYVHPGSYVIPFDASRLSIGTYYCVLIAGRFSRTTILRVNE